MGRTRGGTRDVGVKDSSAEASPVEGWILDVLVALSDLPCSDLVVDVKPSTVGEVCD